MLCFANKIARQLPTTFCVFTLLRLIVQIFNFKTKKMKNTIFNKFPKQPYTIYNVVRCFFAWFTFVGTANWYQGIDEPTLWQRVYKWRISPKTAWTLAKGIWLDGYSK